MNRHSRSDVLILGSDLLRLDLKRAISAGVVATVFILLSTWGIGRVGDAKALVLLEAMLPTTRFLASSIMGAAATILALMLTVLSLSQSMDQAFDKSQFQRIGQIALLSTVLLTSATVLLLILNVPLAESENLQTWYTAVYYVIVVLSSLLGGLLITTIFMLYSAVTAIIAMVRPEDDN